MPESVFQAFASDFVQGIKAATVGSVKKSIQDVKTIASSSENVAGVTGALAATVPLAVTCPMFFFAKGVIRHMAEVAESLPKTDHTAEPMAGPAADPATAPSAQPAP